MPVTAELDAARPVGAHDAVRCQPVGQLDSWSGGRPGGVGKFGQDLQLGPRDGIVDGGQVALDQFAVGSVEDHLGGGGQPDQFRQRERGVGRAAPCGDDDLLHRRVAQGVQRGGRDVGARKVIGVGGQEPRDVEGDVAVADDHYPLMAEVDGQLCEVGMAVDPCDVSVPVPVPGRAMPSMSSRRS